MKSNEDLKARLQEAAGHSEEIIEAGWGTIGPRNVLVGATDTRLILLYVGITLRTKKVDEVPYGQLEAVEVRKGDSTIPGWARINVHNAILNAITTSLIVRKIGERSIHITFRAMPGFSGNRDAGLRLAQAVCVRRPDLPTEVDLRSERKTGESPAGSRFMRAAVITGILFGAPLLIGAGPTAGIAGFVAGAVTGGIFALFWPSLRRTVTGRG